jgi:hypothetical protein
MDAPLPHTHAWLGHVFVTAMVAVADAVVVPLSCRRSIWQTASCSSSGRNIACGRCMDVVLRWIENILRLVLVSDRNVSASIAEQEQEHVVPVRVAL